RNIGRKRKDVDLGAGRDVDRRDAGYRRERGDGAVEAVASYAGWTCRASRASERSDSARLILVLRHAIGGIHELRHLARGRCRDRGRGGLQVCKPAHQFTSTSAPLISSEAVPS